MNKLSSTLLGLAALFVAPYVAAAQEVQPPPKVLVIIREFLKPGKAGAVHEKAEAAFVQAFAKAKSNSHYLAMNSMTGKPRSLFLSGYDSFEAWEKDGKAVEKNASLSSALDRASVAVAGGSRSRRWSRWRQRSMLPASSTVPAAISRM